MLGSDGLWSLKKGSSCLYKHYFPYFHSLNFFEILLYKHNKKYCFRFIFNGTYLLFVTQKFVVFHGQGDKHLVMLVNVKSLMLVGEI